mmetsp:Transcript_29533/g.96481  ORF Transcript_29533/g.96481 Transcript_29533/m.96481 type:complete len:203 (-) Transcript_29533:1984-2592(-)
MRRLATRSIWRAATRCRLRVRRESRTWLARRRGWSRRSPRVCWPARWRPQLQPRRLPRSARRLAWPSLPTKRRQPRQPLPLRRRCFASARSAHRQRSSRCPSPAASWARARAPATRAAACCGRWRTSLPCCAWARRSRCAATTRTRTRCCSPAAAARRGRCSAPVWTGRGSCWAWRTMGWTARSASSTTPPRRCPSARGCPT